MTEKETAGTEALNLKKKFWTTAFRILALV